MSDEQERQEKEEKEEKERDEWGGEKWGEKWSRDPLGTFTWALIIIWAGVVLLLVNLSADGEAILGLDSGNFWAWILTGAGVLIWLEILVRVAMPAYRQPLGGRIILGTIFIMVGASEVVDVELWPLVIIAIGVALLLGYFRGPRRL
jgi:hypothetical protein